MPFFLRELNKLNVVAERNKKKIVAHNERMRGLQVYHRFGDTKFLSIYFYMHRLESYRESIASNHWWEFLRLFSCYNKNVTLVFTTLDVWKLKLLFRYILNHNEVRYRYDKQQLKNKMGLHLWTGYTLLCSITVAMKIRLVPSLPIIIFPEICSASKNRITKFQKKSPYFKRKSAIHVSMNPI